MASTLLRKALLTNPSIIRKTTGLFYAGIRNHWNYQYKPGPYPRTPEERAASAKKYNLTIEEYQPYPEDMGYGDYPMLPEIGADSKDPFYPYDSPEFKRNFNEPFNARAEIFGEDRFNAGYRYRLSNAFMWCSFLGTMAVFFSGYFIFENFKMGRPVTAKQYPKDGPHYAFN